MRIRVGTSGYSYKEWKGSFYPEDLPAAKMLEFYAGRFDTVEINNTFYRMPEAKMLVRHLTAIPMWPRCCERHVQPIWLLWESERRDPIPSWFKRAIL